MALSIRNPEVVPDNSVLAFGAHRDVPFILRSSTLAANTALTGVLVGTVAGEALAANSFVGSNITASGDYALYGNRGGNSEQFLLYDASAGTLYVTSRVTGAFIAQNTADAASNLVATFRSGDRATPANADEGYFSFTCDNANGTQTEYARVIWRVADVTAASEDGSLLFQVVVAGSLSTVLSITTATNGKVSVALGGSNVDTQQFRVGTVADWMELGADYMQFAQNTTIRRKSVAGVAGSVSYDIPIGAGGAANAVVQHSFQLDSVIEAGLLGETDGSGSYTQLKSVWKIPYADAGAGTIGPTAPTTAATWNGGLFLGASNAVANGRLYWNANETLHYVDATAGFSFLHKEPITFGDFNNWKFGDLMALKVDSYNEDGGHALPYPFERAVAETEWAASVEKRLIALERR